jgi:hypothetical protein
MIAFKILLASETLIFVKDLSNSESVPILTSGVEELVSYLVKSNQFHAFMPKIFYEDTIGRVDEIIVSNGVFLRFRLGFNDIDSFKSSSLFKDALLSNTNPYYYPIDIKITNDPNEW